MSFSKYELSIISITILPLHRTTEMGAYGIIVHVSSTDVRKLCNTYDIIMQNLVDINGFEFTTENVVSTSTVVFLYQY